MSVQLSKHMATLFISMNRNDIDICNIKLGPAAKSLKYCVGALEKRIDDFKDEVSLFNWF